MKTCAAVLVLLVLAGESAGDGNSSKMLEAARERALTDRAGAIMILEEVLISYPMSEVAEEAGELLLQLRYVGAVEGIVKAFVQDFPEKIEISPKYLQELIDIVADFPESPLLEEVVAKIVICQLINRVFPSVLIFQEQAKALGADGKNSLQRSEFKAAATYHSAISRLITATLVPALEEVVIEVAKIPAGGQRRKIYRDGISLVKSLRSWSQDTADLYQAYADFLQNDAETCSALFWDKKTTPNAQRCEAIQRDLHGRSSELEEGSRRNELLLNELLLASDEPESQYLVGIFSLINALRL